MTVDTSEIAFVYFDLGNVLLEFDPDVACANLANGMGVTNEAARLVIYDSGLQVRYESGELTGEQYAQQIRLALGRSSKEISTAAVLEAVSDMFVPIPKMREALEAVRDAGLGVGLLSNTCHAHWDWIQRKPFLATQFSFDATILSYEVGAMKPDARIYEAAEQACGVAAEQILFLDDRAENIAGALQRRWRCAELLGGPDAWAALQSHGVVR